MYTTLPPFYWPLGTGTEPAGPPPADLLVLGHDGTRYVVELADGSVWSMSPTSSLDTCFVNASVHHFEACLEALADRRPRLDSTDGEVALDAVGSLRHELYRIDISALGDRDHFWAVVLDQFEDALP